MSFSRSQLVGLALLLSFGGAIVAVGAGCERETRIISRRGLLASVPGATSGIPSASAGERRAVSPGAIAQDLRIENADGDVVLVSRSVRDVLTHVVQTLAQEEEELFLEQVLSDRTRAEFVELGHDPVWAYRELKRRERDVRALFSAMPFGEFTPGLRLDPIGENAFRVSTRRRSGMSWSFVDVVVERGQWRLRWFG